MVQKNTDLSADSWSSYPVGTAVIHGVVTGGDHNM
jgi:hypothetical protein